jgi:hypothetical protein
VALEQREQTLDGPSVARPVAAPPSARAMRAYAIRGLAVAWLGLALVGALAFGPHVLKGGFYLDDWSNGAETLYPPGGSGFAHAISNFSELTLYRPVLVLYVPLTYLVFGTHMGYQLAWAAGLAMVLAALLYGIFRKLGVPRFHAWFIAALTIVYPWYDSTRFWQTADQATVSIVFLCAGLWIALTGLSRRSWRLHCLAAALYLLSILTYEVTLPLVAVLGALYVLRAGWRAARIRWAVDLVVAVIGGLWVGLQTNHESYGLSADFTHFKEIVTSGGTILGRSLFPLGSQRTTIAIVLIALVMIGGLIAYLSPRTRARFQSGWNLGSWLLLAAGGLVVAVLGWAMFIPANPYYTPSIYGVTNRVNALAGIGLVIAIYAVFGVAGALVASLRPKLHVLGGLTVVLGLLLAFGYAKVLERHSKIWNAAYSAEAAGIGELRMQFPKLPAGTTVFVADYPAYQTLGVPIFSANWDVNGMIKLQYKTPFLSAYPIIPGLSLACHPTGVGLQGAGAGPSGATVPYGMARLLDVRTGQHSQPRNIRQCKAVAGSYPAGPLSRSLTY